MLDRCQRQWRTAWFSRTALTQRPAGCSPAGEAAKIAASCSRLSAGCLFPVSAVWSKPIADRVVVQPGILQEFPPPGVVPGSLDPEVDRTPDRRGRVAADVMAQQVVRQHHVTGLTGDLHRLGQLDGRVAAGREEGVRPVRTEVPRVGQVRARPDPQGYLRPARADRTSAPPPAW